MFPNFCSNGSLVAKMGLEDRRVVPLRFLPSSSASLFLYLCFYSSPIFRAVNALIRAFQLLRRKLVIYQDCEHIKEIQIWVFHFFLKCFRWIEICSIFFFLCMRFFVILIIYWANEAGDLVKFPLFLHEMPVVSTLFFPGLHSIEFKAYIHFSSSKLFFF